MIYPETDTYYTLLSKGDFIMCKQESKNGYIQKKYTTLYNHYFVEKPHPALFIGVNKDISKQEFEVIIQKPILNYRNDFSYKLFQLSPENQTIIEKAINDFQRKACFNTHNWVALTDFLFCRYGKTLYDIAGEITGTGTKPKNDNRDKVFDCLNKVKKTKTFPHKETLLYIKEICVSYLISYDLITTGKGYIYSLSPQNEVPDYESHLEKYTIENIKTEILNSKDQIPDTQKIILKLTGLKEEDIFCIPIQVFGDIPALDKSTEDIFLSIMKYMK